MNKRIISTLAIGALAFTAVAPIQGCYGQFALTQKLYKWNGTLGDKWINSIIMDVLCVVQVYTVVAIIDAVALNTAEFWSGKNPVAMGPNEHETRFVTINGKNYILTATQNRMDIAPGKDNVSLPISLVFDPDQKSWFVVEQGMKRKIAEQDGDVMALVNPDGSKKLVVQ